jgi:uracil DNA glycosylase
MNFWEQQVGEKWYNLVKGFFTSKELEKISLTIKEERKNYEVIPSSKDFNKMFEVFRSINPEDVKVVILGLNVRELFRDYSDLNKQGVMLLDINLTSCRNRDEIHKDIWLPFISEILLSFTSVYKDIIFVLWDKESYEYQEYIIDNIILGIPNYKEEKELHKVNLSWSEWINRQLWILKKKEIKWK